jgi:hypothetical protein
VYVDIHQRNGLPNVCCCSHTISRYRQILIHRKPLIRIRQLLLRDMHLGDRYGDAIASAPQRNCSRHVRIAGKPTKEPKRARGGGRDTNCRRASIFCQQLGCAMDSFKSFERQINYKRLHLHDGEARTPTANYSGFH